MYCFSSDKKAKDDLHCTVFIWWLQKGSRSPDWLVATPWKNVR